MGLTLTSVLLILLASLNFFFSFIGRGGVKGLPFETAQCACAPARENGRALTPTMFQKILDPHLQKKKNILAGHVIQGGPDLYYRGCLHKVNSTLKGSDTACFPSLLQG